MRAKREEEERKRLEEALRARQEEEQKRLEEEELARQKQVRDQTSAIPNFLCHFFSIISFKQIRLSDFGINIHFSFSDCENDSDSVVNFRRKH